MIGQTVDCDPVWRTNNKGRPFLIVDGDKMKKLRWPFPRLWKWGWGYIPCPKPHLTWAQVANANERGQKLLKQLRNGPIYEKKGFLYNRAGKVIMTRAIAQIVLHWMEGLGWVLTREAGDKKGFTKVDVDVEASLKNGVGGRKKNG